MDEMREQSLDFVTAGWLRFLPEPAFNAYGRLWLMTASDELVPGDLDELGAEALDLAGLGGFDQPYDPTVNGDAGADEGEAIWGQRWAFFAEQAAKRQMRMATPRDAIEFMRAIGLIERIDADGSVYWRVAVPVPLVEDALDLGDEERENEARMRWHHVFQHAENRITQWLVEQRTAAPTTEVAISLAQLADHLNLDLDETRHGLACAMDQTGDIGADPHPEVADPEQPIKLTVDWVRFAAERIEIRFGDPPEA